MPLSCQHMQQMQIRNSHIRSYLHQINSSYGWGIIDLSIDLQFINNNIVKLNSIECVMHDGSVISFPFNEKAKLEFNLDSSKNMNEFYIFFCVYKNYELGEGKRYTVAEDQGVADIANLDNRVNLSILEYQPFLSSEKSDLHLCMPILKYKSEAEIYQNIPYDPPAMSMHHTKLSNKLILTTIHDMKSLVQEMSISDKIKGDSFKKLSIYAKSLIKLENLLNMEIVHPLKIYNAFLDLSLDLCDTMSGYSQCSTYKYNHDDIYSSFNSIVSFINQHLHDDRTSYSISKYKFNLLDGKFKLVVDAPIKSGSIIIKLLFPKNTHQHQIKAWLSNAFISDEDHIHSHYIERSIGYQREITVFNRDEQNMVVHVNITCPKNSINDIVIYNSLDKYSPTSIYLIERIEKL